MHLKWNNEFSRVIASAVAVLVATSTLNAIPRDPCDPPAPPVCCEEPKPGPFAFAYPYDVDLNCPKDFYFNVSGLLMQAKQDGMEFGLADSTGQIPPSSAGTINHGRMEGFSSGNHDWDFQPGMRVGAGFYLDHDAWNLDFTWTWLNITDYKHANEVTGGGSIIPLLALGVGTPANMVGGRSSATWGTSYNTFDIKLAKPYYVSRYFIVSPHFGVRGGWIDQHFSVDYAGSNADGLGADRNIFHSDNDFWGVGVRTGLESSWILGKGWSLFGNVAASMLAGKFEVDQSYTVSTTQGYNIDHDYYQNVPNFELALGVEWGKFFNKKRNHIGIKAGYEFHEWWDQLNIRKFFSGTAGIPSAATPVTNNIYANDTVSRGNFTLNGFSLEVQLDI